MYQEHGISTLIPLIVSIAFLALSVNIVFSVPSLSVVPAYVMTGVHVLPVLDLTTRTANNIPVVVRITPANVLREDPVELLLELSNAGLLAFLHKTVGLPLTLV
jgi:hypothetical protein